jgi:2-(1,2-epoxy-1,2-dihydrophenyl)acetyl-CoA isomerase
VPFIHRQTDQNLKHLGRLTMSGNSVLLDISDGVATIVLNRPDRLNAFDTEMHQRLQQTLDTVEATIEVRAVLLTGAGRGFCAGQDLSDLAAHSGAAPPDLGDTLERTYNPLVRRLRTLPRPVIVAVNGVAAGAGANLALAGDLVLAARSAKFIQSFCRIGLVPDCGGTWFLPRLVGPARAAGFAMLGDALTAGMAAEWGLIWRVVDDDNLADEAAALAHHLAKQPTQALAQIKRALLVSWGNTLDQQLDLERDAQRALGQSEDYHEGITAFLGKRPAKFTGR